MAPVMSRRARAVGASLGFAAAASTAFVQGPAPTPSGPIPARTVSLAQPSTSQGQGQGGKLGCPSGSALAAAAAVCAFGLAGRRRDAASRKSKRVAVRISQEFTGVCEQTGITLNRYMIEATKRGIVDMDMQSIFNSIREATKVIAKLVNRAPLSQAELLGAQGAVNVQGEDQKKLDVITNEVLKKALQYTGKLGTLASEEEDVPMSGNQIRTDDGEVISRGEALLTETGKYVCVFDPLDGSSNVDAGIAVGTIFGIFREQEADSCDIPADMTADLDAIQANCLASTLQPGKSLVAAGYVLYSCSTEMVFTVGRGVVGFTLDTTIGEYVLTRPSIVIPKRGKIYSANEANFDNWDQPMQDYIRSIQGGVGESGKKYSLRYIGSMVGDVHRTLLYGGIFAYPADAKNLDGKLRLLYEAAPMSFIVEQAGGKATTGHSRVMDIPPTGVHQRVPIILGSSEDVEECQKYYTKSKDPTLKARCEQRMKGMAGRTLKV